MAINKGKNKGEWSEMYIFLKLLSDRRVYVADKEMNKLKDVFLDIISIIREETLGQEYRYYTGEFVNITLNGNCIKSIHTSKFTEQASKIWNMIITNKGGTTFTDEDVRAFLDSIYIHKITSPAEKYSDYLGGTKDIVLNTRDYRSGVEQIMGFSCKSDIDAASTLFNASGDNTNFEYELVGNIDDTIMNTFNSIYKKVIKKDGISKQVAISDRMQYLVSIGIDLKFVRTAQETAGQNLIRCGGLETPRIVAELLKFYYYIKLSKDTSINEAIQYLADNDSIGYGFGDVYDTYYLKIANLLYSMFTGLRFAKPWNGKSDISGGYIVVKRDGEVVAFHSCIADEFKDFLVDKLRFETPSCSRHNYMKIYKKDNGKYYLKLALQLRFKLKK